MYTASFKLLPNPAYTSGRVYLAEDGGYTSSVDGILWLETKKEAKAASKGMSPDVHPEILSDEDVARLELAWKQKKLEKHRKEKKKAAKLTKAEQKAILNKMIRDGAKLVKQLDLTLPPISTKIAESTPKAEKNLLLNEITLTQDGYEIAKMDRMISDGAKILKKLDNSVPPISTKLTPQD
jgi:hypothetical protein